MCHRNKIDIKQAIDYVARSWDEVTSTTIVNCWKKTGILPSSIDGNQNEADMEQEDEAGINDVINTATSLSTDIANQIGDYVKAIDEPLLTEDNLSEVDIISMIRDDAAIEFGTTLSDSDEENEEVKQSVSNTEALIHLKSIIRYQEQSPDEVFTSNEMTILRRKISVFEHLIDKSKKQTTLDSFFEK